jgi:hypothetical protein
MLEIEFATPAVKTCECCGGATTTLTRYVTIDDRAQAVYFASFSDNHPEQVVSVLLSLGPWWEGAGPEGRVSFGLKIWQTKERYNVGVVDADGVGWPNSKLMGRRLTRDEALSHPRINEAFHISDHIVAEDPEIRAYLSIAAGTPS